MMKFLLAKNAINPPNNNHTTLALAITHDVEQKQSVATNARPMSSRTCETWSEWPKATR